MEFREQLVPEATLEDWQTVVDLVARLSGVKAALIMKAWYEEDKIEVLVSSQTPGNPYHPGEKETLRSSGLYCERVLQTRSMLSVPNALKSPEWCRNPDLKLGMISYLGLPILQPDGQPFGTICILDDQEYVPSPDVVTLLEKMRDLLEGHLRLRDRLRLQQLLADESLLRKVLDSLPTSILFATLPPRSQVVYLNEHFRQACGWSQEDLPTLKAWQARMSPAPEAWLAELERLGSAAPPLDSFQHDFTCRDGSVRRKLTSALVVDGMLVASSMDTTERDRSQAELRASEQRHRLLADHAVDVIWTLDLQSRRMTYVSPSVQTLTGFSPEECRQMALEDLLAEESLPLVQEALDELGAGHPVEFKSQEVLQRRRDGSNIWTEVTATSLNDAEGRFLGILGISRDISRRKENQARLLKALEENQLLVSQLREALEKVKTLSGMLPICSHCKQIRDDEGYWQRLERYIEARTEATFSHGLCPACTWKLYPEMAAELEAEMETGA